MADFEDIYVYGKEKFVYRNLPDFTRFPRRIDWLLSLVEPVDSNIDLINDYRIEKLIQLSYTGQTTVLQKALNDLFDNDLRRITIVHENKVNVYTFYDAEGQPNEIWTYYDTEGASEADTTFLYYNAEQPGIDLPENIDFRVICPLEIEDQEDQIRGVIGRYKIASKRFDLVFV